MHRNFSAKRSCIINRVLDSMRWSGAGDRLSWTVRNAPVHAVDYNVTGYNVAPDLSKYKFDPYPPLKDDKGNQSEPV
jgi:hypothetical protein